MYINAAEYTHEYIYVYSLKQNQIKGYIHVINNIKKEEK